MNPPRGSALAENETQPETALTPEELSSKFAFLKRLQAIAQRLQGAGSLEEVLDYLSVEVCDAFECDRLTLYTVSEDRSSIVSRLKTGLQSFKDIKLPINDTSIAGFVAHNRMALNIVDAYDDKELKQHAPPLTFLKAVDKRTGYRTAQVLAAPVVGSEGSSQELLAVVQLINTRNRKPFTALAQEALVELTSALEPVLAGRHPKLTATHKFARLVRVGTISSGELELAQNKARRDGRDLEEVLEEELNVSADNIALALAEYYGVQAMHFTPNLLKPVELYRNLKRHYVDSNEWLPIEDGPEGRIIVTTDPERVRTSRMVEFLYPGVRLDYRVATRRDFARFVDHMFGADSSRVGSASIGELLSGMDDESHAPSAAEEASAAQDNELVKLVNRMIEDAFHQGASDIHIEPYPGRQKTQIRFRKDGTLVPYIEVPASYRNALVTRIKIMCDLDISEKRKPQDGKIRFRRFGPLDIELRVATLPSAGGMEDVVMRVLAHGEPLPLEKLGLSKPNYTTLKQLLVRPHGLLFVCGPTGSGKTTTLHSALKYINTPERKIWTAEDPVEITQRGLRQVQVHPKIGLTFAAAMRSFLRADPDVIMVGEMRDAETTSMAIEASLTGHLVLATLHTNSAPESVIRLLDMGMDPFNFADALVGILAQRLVKRLCSKCSTSREASEEEIDLLIEEYALDLAATSLWKKNPKDARARLRESWQKDFGDANGKLMFGEPVGCEACDRTGYKGRLGVHELLVASDEIKRIIQERGRVPELFATGLSEGMRTLKQDGIEKVLQQVTDMHQVRAVCAR